MSGRPEDVNNFTIEFSTNKPLSWEKKNAILGGTKDRPAILAMCSPIYEHESSRYPEKIRISFMDGRTEVYEIRTQQPHPIIMENIKLIRKMKQGYVNKPRRRRKG